jgi:hypothetical protein
VPDIISTYYTRSSLISFCRNNFRNGLWAILPFKYSRIVPVSLRHLVPLVFVSSLLGSLLLFLLHPLFFWLFCFIAGLYVLTDIFFSIKAVKKEKRLQHFFAVVFLFGALHFFYGFGSLWGLIRILLSKSFWKNWLSKTDS